MRNGQSAGIFAVIFGPSPDARTADDAEGPDPEPDPAPRSPTCWFCRTEIREPMHAVMPGGQTMWRICRTCTIEAAVSLILSSALSVGELIAACSEAIARRRTDAARTATQTVEPLEAAADRIRTDIATIARAAPPQP